MDSLKKSISVVIPNYNGLNLLKAYLPDTIHALDNAGVSYEIIVVDDASTDGSAAFLEEKYPEIRLIVNKKNSGFSFSCNRGLEMVRHDLTLFLNTDIQLSPDYFEKQWKYFQHPDAFGVMGRIIKNSNNKIEVAARFPQLEGLKFKTDKLFFPQSEGTPLPTIFLSGANALVSTEKVKKLGGFDETFSPYYSEDLDLGLRAWKMGWKSYYEHRSTCQHLGSYTTKTQCQKDDVKRIYFRNRFFVHAVHLEKSQLPLWYVRSLLLEVLPKICIGQIWIIKSFMALFTQKEAISNSRDKLKNLMDANHNQRTLKSIQNEFNSTLTSTPVNWV